MDGADALPRDALVTFLERELDESVHDVAVLHDGLNLAVAVTTPAGDPAYLLRRPTGMRDTEGFVDLETERAVLERLADTPVPAPEPVAFWPADTPLDGPVLACTYIEGTPVQFGDPLPAAYRTPAGRERFANRLVDALATLHDVDADRFADVCDRRPPSVQLSEVATRLDRTGRATGRETPVLREVLDRLRGRTPPEGPLAVIHGDFRPGNVVFADGDRGVTDDGSPAGDDASVPGEADDRVVAGVIDWETPSLGDPLVEVGYLLLLWPDPDDPSVPVEALADRHDDAALESVRALADDGFHPFATEPGSPDRRELLAAYGRDVDRFLEHERFYRALAAVLLAGVWEDLHRRRLAADEPSDFGALSDYVALRARAILDGEYPL